MLTRTGLSPEPDKSTPYSPILLFDTHLVIILPDTCRSSKWSLRVFQPHHLVHTFLFFSCMQNGWISFKWYTTVSWTVRYCS
jgi:hypothetical protein